MGVNARSFSSTRGLGIRINIHMTRSSSTNTKWVIMEALPTPGQIEHTLHAKGYLPPSRPTTAGMPLSDEIIALQQYQTDLPELVARGLDTFAHDLWLAFALPYNTAQLVWERAWRYANRQPGPNVTHDDLVAVYAVYRDLASLYDQHLDQQGGRILLVFAVGDTPEGAIAQLCAANDWGELSSIEDLPGGRSDLDWGRRFVAGGTSFKAAGSFVPGGAVITWWK